MTSLLRYVAAASVTIGLAAAPASGGAKTVGPSLPPLVVEGLEPIGKYRILIDDKPAAAQHVALAARAGSIYLLRAKELGAGVLVRPRERDVVAVPHGAVQPQLDGTFTVDLGGPGDSLGPFAVDDGGLVFPYQGHQVRLGQAPILLGERSPDELLSKQDGYAFRARQFVPRAAALQALARAPEGVRVKTFFGSWCGACSQKIPRLLRISQDLRGAEMRFEFYGVPSPFKGEPEATKYAVTSVPTGVVLAGDEEVGRLTGDDWEHPADSLRKILEKAKKL